MRVKKVVLALMGTLLASEALGQEFKCPAGARDSGERPDMVVRWCETKKDGRLLYHGPVWRWHRNGQLMSKESYVNGDMDGEIPSWWENGKQSSLGTFRLGKRIGSWKFWDEQGRIKFEVRYGDAGTMQTEFYPSGAKRATGSFDNGAKLGLWLYFKEDGSEKARCDFGQGLFSPPKDAGCRAIIKELTPEGFSRPVPKGNVAPDGAVTVTIGPYVFAFMTPTGWAADAAAGSEEGLPVVLVPRGGKWRESGRNMYIRPIFKEGRPFEAVVADEGKQFSQNVVGYAEKLLRAGKVQGGQPYVAKTITYRPLTQTDSPFSIVQSTTIQEATAFVDVSPEVALLLVLACEGEADVKDSLPSLIAAVESVRLATEGRAK